MSDEVIATVYASAGRRILGIVSLTILGFLLIYLCFAKPPSLLGQMFLSVIGLGSLWLADSMRRATSYAIELTETEIRDSSGIVIARIDDIVSIDRGVFAFKPSNGFLLRTKKPEGRTWRPGLWWRVGRQIGVGGMTPGHQTKPMSQIIAATIAQRDLDDLEL